MTTISDVDLNRRNRARQMLKAGDRPAEVAAVTGLSLAVVDELAGARRLDDADPPARPTPPPRPGPPAMSRTDQVLAAGTNHSQAAIRRRAERIRELLGELATLIAEDATKEAARQEVATLEAQLKAAREKLRPGKPAGSSTAPSSSTSPASGRSIDYDPKVVRAWAREQGIEVPVYGRYLAEDVVAAWRAAVASE